MNLNGSSVTQAIGPTYLNLQPDLLVPVVMAGFVVILLLGTSRTSSVGNVLCAFNVCLLLAIIGIGVTKGHLDNWTDTATGEAESSCGYSMSIHKDG